MVCGGPSDCQIFLFSFSVGSNIFDEITDLSLWVLREAIELKRFGNTIVSFVILYNKDYSKRQAHAIHSRDSVII